MRPAAQTTTAPLSLEASAKYLSLSMIFAALIFAITDLAAWYVGLSACSMLVWVLRHRSQWQLFGKFGGVANALTGFRWLSIAVLCGFCLWLHPYVIFVLGILVLVADGLDGYYARKYHTTSVFGDVFDKETDAFFVLTYGVIIVERDLAESWVMLPGLLRYLYVIILSYVDRPSSPIGKSFRRQFVGMWMMGTLLAPFVVGPKIYIPGLAVAIIMILYSFALDFYSSWNGSEVSNRKLFSR